MMSITTWLRGACPVFVTLLAFDVLSAGSECPHAHIDCDMQKELRYFADAMGLDGEAMVDGLTSEADARDVLIALHMRSTLWISSIYESDEPGLVGSGSTNGDSTGPGSMLVAGILKGAAFLAAMGPTYVITTTMPPVQHIDAGTSGACANEQCILSERLRTEENARFFYTETERVFEEEVSHTGDRSEELKQMAVESYNDAGLVYEEAEEDAKEDLQQIITDFGLMDAARWADRVGSEGPSSFVLPYAPPALDYHETYDFETPPGTPEWKKLAAARRYQRAAQEYTDGSTTYREERQALVDTGGLLIDAADGAYADGETSRGDGLLKTALGIFDAVLDFTPGLGFVKDAVTIATGVNPITGEEVSATERALLATSLFVPAAIAGTAKGLIKTGKIVSKIARSGKRSAGFAQGIVDTIRRSDDELLGLGGHIPCMG